MNFENTPRGNIFQSLYSSVPYHLQSTVSALYDSLIAIEQDNVNLTQNYTNLKNNLSSLSLNIVKTLSPPNNESPSQHHERCLAWLEEFKKIQ